jgi:hypothetical protein
MNDSLTDFQKLTRAVEILTPHVCVGWPSVTAEHDQIWLHFGHNYHDYDDEGQPAQVRFDEHAGEYVLLDPSPLSPDEAAEMQAMGFFVDSEVGSWSMFC